MTLWRRFVLSYRVVALAATLGLAGCRCEGTTDPRVEDASASTITPIVEEGDVVRGEPDRGEDDRPRRVASLTTTRPPTSLHRCGDALVVGLMDGRVGELLLEQAEITFDLWTSMAPPARFIGCVDDAIVFVDSGGTRVVVRDIEARRDIGSFVVDGRVVDVALDSRAGRLWTLERDEDNSVAVVRDATIPNLPALGSATLGATPIGFVSTDTAQFVADFRGRRVDRLTVSDDGEVASVVHDVGVRPVGLVVVDDRVHVRTMNSNEAHQIGSSAEEPPLWPWPIGGAIDTGDALWIYGSSNGRIARIDRETLQLIAERGNLPDAIALIDRGEDIVVVRAGAEPGITWLDTARADVIDAVALDTRPGQAVAHGRRIVVLQPEENRIDVWDFGPDS